ncbi:hypothetical protein CICLE_v10029841mg, partial [Citrus x clementina]
VYIVYMGSLPEGEYLPSSHHQSILEEVVEGSSAENILVRSYKRSFNGFAAKLTDHEIQKLAGMKGVVSVFPSRTLQLHTTRSWDFMGFNESITQRRTVESDLIVGVIDTGIWPESESFSDEGFGPAPKKWKGACDGGKNFTCNNKIIGARYYSFRDDGNGSAIDEEGHGSHTASTAAGNKVKDASFLGIGQGMARGGVPSARISAYRVCYPAGCEGEKILAAFDDAIADGVDIITISLGDTSAVDLAHDVIAIGAFHAMTKGILTVNSAGNNGPKAGFTSSIAPWLMSVAASTTDRLFVDKVVLGNGKTIVGYSINAFTHKGKMFLLLYGKGVTNSSSCTEDYAKRCRCGVDSLVKGNIVLCDEFSGYHVAREAGAAGLILKDNRLYNVSLILPFPASTEQNPQAEILKTSVIKDSDAPIVASFSSRGPNKYVPDILKPDISAPGVNILAAYSPLAPVSRDIEDERHVKYNIISGTSMACPHAAGVAAYVKQFHPDSSPSAIKSAIMTTAWPMNSSKNTQAEFAYGSGHINPVKATNPGLVYEAFKQDYINMLCSMENIPSMAAQVSSGESFTIKFPRTVTNIGLPNSTYKARILQNSKISVNVVPEVLSFRSLNEKKSFIVTVTGKGLASGSIVSAALVWFDGSHIVRSPIVVHSQGVQNLNKIPN